MQVQAVAVEDIHPWSQLLSLPQESAAGGGCVGGQKRRKEEKAVGKNHHLLPPWLGRLQCWAMNTTGYPLNHFFSSWTSPASWHGFITERDLLFLNRSRKSPQLSKPAIELSVKFFPQMVASKRHWENMLHRRVNDEQARKNLPPL